MCTWKCTSLWHRPRHWNNGGGYCTLLAALAVARWSQLEKSVTSQAGYQAHVSLWCEATCLLGKKQIWGSRAKKTLLFYLAYMHSASKYENKSHGFFQVCEEDGLFTCPSSSDCAALGVIKDRTYALSLVPSDAVKGDLLLCLPQSEEMCWEVQCFRRILISCL